MFEGKQIITFADYGGEKSVFSINTPEVMAANLDVLMNQQDTLKNAVQNLSRGYWVRRSRVIFVDGPYPALNNDPLANRELKWLIVYQDDVTGKNYRCEIPCARLTTGADGRLLANSENANFGSTWWTAFISAFETAAVSPVGNPVSVISAKYVGRNI